MTAPAGRRNREHLQLELLRLGDDDLTRLRREFAHASIRPASSRATQALYAELAHGLDAALQARSFEWRRLTRALLPDDAPAGPAAAGSAAATDRTG